MRSLVKCSPVPGLDFSLNLSFRLRTFLQRIIYTSLHSCSADRNSNLSFRGGFPPPRLAICLSPLPSALLSNSFKELSAKDTQTTYPTAYLGLLTEPHQTIQSRQETETSSRGWETCPEADSQVGSTPGITPSGVIYHLSGVFYCLLSHSWSGPNPSLSQ